MSQTTAMSAARPGSGKLPTAGTYELGDRAAVVVVDLTYGFTDPTSPLGSAMDDAVTCVAQMLETARAQGVPIIFTRIVFRTERPVWFEKVPDLEVLTSDSRWIELDERLGRRADEPLLDKEGASAFMGTPLLGALVALGVDTLVVVGASTSGCVRATVVDGMQYGFRVVAVSDAVADRDVAAHVASLRDMELKYANVESSEAVADYLRRIRR